MKNEPLTCLHLDTGQQKNLALFPGHRADDGSSFAGQPEIHAAQVRIRHTLRVVGSRLAGRPEDHAAQFRTLRQRRPRHLVRFFVVDTKGA